MNSSVYDTQYDDLRVFSTALGNDPLQVQGAGGNTSLKSGNTMWIKASGTWLAQAVDTELFVPVALEPLLSALAKGDLRAEKSTDFVRQELNPDGLRPSIETTVHAALPYKVVAHVHCVDTIALAIQSNAQLILDALLKDFNWLWVPYFRPGLPLSRYISAHLESGVDVIVLGNHGLVVAADSVTQTAALLERVRVAVRQPVRTVPSHDPERLQQLCADTEYAPAMSGEAHAIAFNGQALSVAAGGSLYPDHVIFLGEGTVFADATEALSTVVDKIEQDRGTTPMSIVVPGAGVLMHRKANASQHAMARCLTDVCLRVADGARINYLSSDETFQLLNWEAETYRQSIAT